MDNSEILEGNKLIAEFMGLPHNVINDKVYLDEMDMVIEAEYNSDWNWIMPVLDKIINRTTIGSPKDSFQGFCLNQGKKDIFNALATLDINHVFSFAVKFIDWYNKQPNK